MRISGNWLMEHLRQPLLRNSMLLAVSRLVTVAAGFVYWIVAARYYSISEVGVAAGLISALGLVILFSRLGLDISIVRFLPTGDRRTVVNTSLALTTYSSVIAASVCILALNYSSPSMSFILEPGYALSFVAISVLSSIVAIVGSAFLAMRKGGHYLLQNVLLATRIPILIPLAFLGSYGIFGSWGIACLIATLVSILRLAGSFDISFKVGITYVRESFTFSAGSYLSSVLSNGPVLIMPMLVLSLSGEADAARYYVAFAIGHLVLIIPDAFSTSLFVEGSHGAHLRKTVIIAGAAIYALLIPTVIVLGFAGETLISLIGSDYVGASQLLSMLAISSLFYAICSLYVSVQNVRMRVSSVVKLNSVRCILLLGLSYILLQRYGIVGIGYAWLVTYILLSIAVLILVKMDRLSTRGITGRV